MLIGLAFGLAVRWLLGWMRSRDAGRDQQICLTLAVAYLSFYVANSPANVSGQCCVHAPSIQIVAKTGSVDWRQAVLSSVPDRSMHDLVIM